MLVATNIFMNEKIKKWMADVDKRAVFKEKSLIEKSQELRENLDAILNHEQMSHPLIRFMDSRRRLGRRRRHSG